MEELIEAGRNIGITVVMIDEESRRWDPELLPPPLFVADTPMHVSLPQPCRHSNTKSCFNFFRRRIRRPSCYNTSSSNLPQPRDQYSSSKYSCFNFIRRLIRTRSCNSTSSLPPLVQAEQTSIFSIPHPILMQILTKLPVTAIRNCRCVCSCFRNLISDPQFAQLNLSTISQPSLLLSFPFYGYEFPMHFVELIDLFIVDSHFKEALENQNITVDTGDVWVPDYTNLKFKLKWDIPTQGLEVSSCNGLLCLYEDSTYKPYVICNPVIKEYVIVPQIKKDSFRLCGSGFGFCPRTNQYKVLRFLEPSYPNTIQYISEAEINTVGSNLWRRVNDAPQHVNFYSGSCYLNGALHWIVRDTEYRFESMCCFDFENERFQPFPGPPQLCGVFSRQNSVGKMTMGLLNDVMSIFYKPTYSMIDVWVMKNYAVQESWTKDFVIEIPQIEYFRVKIYRPLMVLNNVVVFFFDSFCEVYSWDIRTRSLRRVRFNGISVVCAAMTYIPSFVSIKNVTPWRQC